MSFDRIFPFVLGAFAIWHHTMDVRWRHGDWPSFGRGVLVGLWSAGVLILTMKAILK